MVAKGKELVLSAETLAGELAARKPEAVCAQLAKVAEAVCTLTETTAQAVFMVAEKTPGCVNLLSSFYHHPLKSCRTRYLFVMYAFVSFVPYYLTTHASNVCCWSSVNHRCVKAVPGAVDMYVLHRGKLAIEIAAAGFTRETLGQDQMLAISAVLATHLELIRGELLSSADRRKKSHPHDAAVFSAAANSLSGNAAVLVAAIKAFAAAPSPEARSTAVLFTKPILVSLDTLIEYGSDARFRGTPPKVGSFCFASSPPLPPRACVPRRTFHVEFSNTMKVYCSSLCKSFSCVMR